MYSFLKSISEVFPIPSKNKSYNFPFPVMEVICKRLNSRIRIICQVLDRIMITMFYSISFIVCKCSIICILSVSPLCDKLPATAPAHIRGLPTAKFGVLAVCFSVTHKLRL